MFYVYLHKKASDGSVFYVGKGCNKRAWWEHGRSNYWQRIKNKHGLIVEIYKDGLTEHEAHLIEMRLIKKIGRENLCNHTDGGEGMSGWIASEETKKKFSIIRKGRMHSEESKKKMSESRKGLSKSMDHNKKTSESLKGRKFSDEHRKNISESIRKIKFNPEWGEKSGKARMKKVICINNSFEYESTKHAAKDLSLDSGSISRVCRGLYKHTKGFIFRYAENENS